MEYPQVTKLYKYRDFSSRTLNMLANNEIYFAFSDSFNDPFDCRARKEFEFKGDEDFIQKWTPLEASQQNISIEEAYIFVKKITESEELKENYIKQKSELFQKLVLQSFGICSFSEVPDNILMWSHYSDSHKGLCAIFNRSPDNNLAYARPIEYPEDDEFPYINYWLGPNPNSSQLDEIIKIIVTKSKHWNYEKEWRLVDRPDDINDKYRGHLITYSDELLDEVIFGSRIDSKSKMTIRDTLAKKSINYYEARPVKNKFRVEIVKVD
jgi:DUF2971 family protein